MKNIEEIIWKWDPEPEWDPYTLLGTIEIKDTFGNSIIEECIMIDDWITPIMNGLKSLQKNEPCKFEIMSEPSPLIFDIDRNGKLIRYQNQIIHVIDENNLLKSLRKISKDILVTIKEKSKIIDPHAVQLLEEVIRNC